MGDDDLNDERSGLIGASCEECRAFGRLFSASRSPLRGFSLATGVCDARRLPAGSLISLLTVWLSADRW